MKTTIKKIGRVDSQVVIRRSEATYALEVNGKPVSVRETYDSEEGTDYELVGESTLTEQEHDDLFEDMSESLSIEDGKEMIIG